MMELLFDGNALEELNEAALSEEDIARVLRMTAADGIYVKDNESGHCITHKRIGYVTVWVEYEALDTQKTRIYKVYAHRMEIVEQQ